MTIGNKDKSSNTLILGGWKADLYLAPNGTYLIGTKSTQNEKEALSLYNLLNNTKLLYIPKPREDIVLEIPFLKPGDKVLGKSESSSQPSTFHYVIQPNIGDIYCTCTGFGTHKHCWHYDLIMEIGQEKLEKGPIIIKKGDNQ